MTHRIENISDILKAVNSENIDNFLKDFGESLNTIVLFKNIDKDLKWEHFDWTDDGKNNVEMTLKFQS